jgi:trehalose-phosphatase
MKHLFKDWGTLQTRIRQARNLLLFLDYDGTLTPIVSRPDRALCPIRVRRLLETLRDLPGVHLAIVSGRSLEDVRRKVGVAGIVYVGNHGLEIEKPGGRPGKPTLPAGRRELKEITRNVQKALKDMPGILFEEKGPVLSVHYRNVPRKYFAQIPRVIEEELRSRKGRWKTASGKRVLEIRPNADFNKGKAVKEIMRGFSSGEALPFYLGDDQTDEDAFRVLKGRGISVFIGPGRFPSGADFFLLNPAEVHEFLSRCQKVRRPGCSAPGVP